MRLLTAGSLVRAQQGEPKKAERCTKYAVLFFFLLVGWQTRTLQNDASHFEEGRLRPLWVLVGSSPTGGATKKITFVYQTKVIFFELSVPLPRNVKCPSDVKRTACVKCAYGTICGTLNFTLSHRNNTSLCRKA